MSQIYFWMNLDQPHQRKRQKIDQNCRKNSIFVFQFFFSNFATITLQTLLIWQAIFCNHFMVLTKSYVLGQLKEKQLTFDLNYYGFGSNCQYCSFLQKFSTYEFQNFRRKFTTERRFSVLHKILPSNRQNPCYHQVCLGGTQLYHHGF